MIMDWLGCDLDVSGINLVGPILGSVIFLSGSTIVVPPNAQPLRRLDSRPAN